MEIVGLRCYTLDLPLAVPSYTMSGGRALTSVTTTIVEVTSANGVHGFGEACTLGANYIEDFPGANVEAVRLLAPVVVGADVLAPRVLLARMDAAVKGHQAAKSAIDAACLDLRGKLLGVPAYVLLGGRYGDRYPIFHPLTLAGPDEMAREAQALAGRGYRHWQLKIGEDPETDARRVQAVVDVLGPGHPFITADANGAWTLPQAQRFVRAVEHLPVYVEQPCATLEETAQIRARCTLPVVVDEVVRTPADLLTAVGIRAADAVNIKPARVGGLTRAAQLRDCVEAAGMMLMVDDPLGGLLAMAGIAHLAVATNPKYLLAATHMASTHVEPSALAAMTGGPRVQDGWGIVSEAPGLGVEVDVQRLGEPVVSYP
jgi:L-alanine-DL-glutamate epimerase-like enolase superfamily enzyme